MQSIRAETGGLHPGPSHLLPPGNSLPLWRKCPPRSPARGRCLLPRPCLGPGSFRSAGQRVTEAAQDPGLWAPVPLLLLLFLLLWDPGVPAPKHLHVQLKAGGHLQQQSEDVFVESMCGRGDRFPIWGLGGGWATASLLNPASPPASVSIHHPRWGPQQSSHFGGGRGFICAAGSGVAERMSLTSILGKGSLVLPGWVLGRRTESWIERQARQEGDTETEQRKRAGGGPAPNLVFLPAGRARVEEIGWPQLQPPRPPPPEPHGVLATGTLPPGVSPAQVPAPSPATWPPGLVLEAAAAPGQR